MVKKSKEETKSNIFANQALDKAALKYGYTSFNLLLNDVNVSGKSKKDCILLAFYYEFSNKLNMSNQD